MKIFAYPPRKLWQQCLAEIPSASGSMPEIDLERLDVIISALSSLYQVQARLWSIPDKAEVLPGVTCQVSRTPLESVVLDCPADVSYLELVSALAAARAAGVGEIYVDLHHGPLCDAPSFHHIVKAFNVTAQLHSPAGRLAIGKQLPRSGRAVIVTDAHTQVSILASYCTLLLEMGVMPLVVTASPRICGSLPVMMKASECAVILLKEGATVTEFINKVHPSLIIALNEEGRRMAGEVRFQTNIVLGAMPGGSMSGSIAALNAPVIPIHYFTRSTLVIDPLTAR